MSVMQPLSEKLLESVYDITRRWHPYPNQEKVMMFLEDRLTNIMTSVHHDVAKDRTSSRTLPELVALETFYTVALLRYLQKTLGFPKHVQHLPTYDTRDGNQIDTYLEEFFKSSLPP